MLKFVLWITVTDINTIQNKDKTDIKTNGQIDTYTNKSAGRTYGKKLNENQNQQIS